MNFRQRRGVMFVTASIVFLLVGASALGGYVRDVDEQVGPKVQVVVAERDLQPYVPLTDRDVEIVEVPQRWLPAHAITDEVDALGKVAPIALQDGAYLTDDVVVSRPELAPGQREIAILIDAETGVAGKVEPGSLVDIVATFSDDATGEGRSEVIVASAQVIDVGDLRPDSGDNGNDEEFQQSRVVPVTFALSVQDTLVLTYAESFAQHVRLALVAPNDGAPPRGDDRVYTGG